MSCPLYLLQEVGALEGVVGAVSDDPTEVLSQHEGYPLSLEAKLLFPVVKKVAKVNVEHLENTCTAKMTKCIKAPWTFY